MQKDIPPVPIEPVINTTKKALKLIRNTTKKSYIQKKSDKEDVSFWD